MKNIFHRQINNITIAAILVASASLTSRVLGVLRDHILAGQFGASSTLDVYYAAFRIPDLVFNLIVLGALSAGFIPIFTSLIKDFKCSSQSNKEKGNKEAWGLVNNLLNILLLIIIVLSVLGIIFAGPLTKLIAPGFGVKEQLLTAKLTRIMFLSPIFLGISGILGGILQSFRRFLVYSLSPVFYNIGIIIGALYFVRYWGIMGLAFGVVLGAFFHMIIQFPSIYKLGFRYHFKIKWKDKYTWKIARMMVPRTSSLAVSQLNLLVITIIASHLSSGSLTVFNLANNLQSFPVGIFGISFAIAAFPALSKSAFNVRELKVNFSSTIRKIMFFVIPASVLIIVLRAQIIRVVLGTGNFNWQDTVLTMNTLAFFAVSLFAQASLPLLVRVFYARHNSLTPFYISLVSVITNIVFSWYLSKTMGVAGLALAFSIASIINFILLFIYLRIKVANLDLHKIIISSSKFIVAALASGMSAQIMKGLIWPFIDMTKFIGVSIQLLVSSAVGILVYILFCYLLGSEEFMHFVGVIGKKIRFNKVEVGEQGEINQL